MYLMVIICPKSNSNSLTWAIKIAATASYSAVPSMLMVAPTGSTNRATRRSMPLFSRRHLSVMGKVAELRNKKGAVTLSFTLSFINRNQQKGAEMQVLLRVNTAAILYKLLQQLKFLRFMLPGEYTQLAKESKCEKGVSVAAGTAV